MNFTDMFQFLIGTIKTQKIYDDIEIIEYVSIPHRYDKNEDLLDVCVTKTTPVSIPHRYDKNAYPLTCRLGSCLFQFLIGTIKTSHS